MSISNIIIIKVEKKRERQKERKNSLLPLFIL